MDMKILACLLCATSAFAASPSFNSFSNESFTISGSTIGVNTNFVATWGGFNLFSLQGQVLLNSNGVPVGTTGLTVSPTTRNVGIGLSNAPYRLTVNMANTGIPQVVYTNTSGSSAAWAFPSTDANMIMSSGSGGLANFSARADVESYLQLITTANTADSETFRLVNSDDRLKIETYLDSGALKNTPVEIAADAPDSTLVIDATGVALFNAGGTGYGSTRQVTAATNAVRIFAEAGINVSVSNNTANGSLDYRLSVAGTTGWAPPAQVSLAYTGLTNVIVDLAASQRFYLLATNNFFLIFTNRVPQWTNNFDIQVEQDAAGIRVGTFDTNVVRFSGGVPGLFSTNAGTIDIVTGMVIRGGTNVAVVMSTGF